MSGHNEFTLTIRDPDGKTKIERRTTDRKTNARATSDAGAEISKELVNDTRAFLEDLSSAHNTLKRKSDGKS